MMLKFQYLSLILMIAFEYYTTDIYGQSCPACSNPAIQSNEKIEAGFDSLYKGSFRYTFIGIAGFNYEGGHPNRKGLNPDKDTINVPLHNHVVELDFYRFQLNLEYTFANNWVIWLQVPYDIKVQTANIEFVEPVSTYDSLAILRNRNIHHRNETYKGFSDAKFLISHRLIGLIGQKDRLDIAIGTSLPLGGTEENPLEAGEHGEKHLHIQFGTGTFNPLLEMHYLTRIGNRTTLSFFTINKFPFYENNKTYRGSIESTAGLGASYVALKWLVLRTNISQLYMSAAFWDGEKDPNSGLYALNSMVAATIKCTKKMLVSPIFRFPVYQRTLSSEGDTFKFGPTFLLNVSYLLTI